MRIVVVLFCGLFLASCFKSSGGIEENVRPALNVSTRTIEVGEDFFYQIRDEDVTYLGEGDTYTITITNDGGTGITYSSESKTFSTRALALGDYTIEGILTIRAADELAEETTEKGIEYTWTFQLNVVAYMPPVLNVTSQDVEAGGTFFYAIPEGGYKWRFQY